MSKIKTRFFNHDAGRDIFPAHHQHRRSSIFEATHQTHKHIKKRKCVHFCITFHVQTVSKGPLGCELRATAVRRLEEGSADLSSRR